MNDISINDRSPNFVVDTGSGIHFSSLAGVGKRRSGDQSRLVKEKTLFEYLHDEYTVLDAVSWIESHNEQHSAAPTQSLFVHSKEVPWRIIIQKSPPITDLQFKIHRLHPQIEAVPDACPRGHEGDEALGKLGR